MRVWLDKVREQPFRWQEERVVDLAEVGHPDLVGLGPVEWLGEVVFADPSFLLTGSYSYEQTLACTRCLRPIVEPVRGDLQLVVVPGPEPVADGEHALLEEDLGVVHAPGGELDLDPLLLEQLQLEVPMKPLCRPDCPGMCPSCGADLVDGACECRREDVDPRWAALRGLRSGPEGGD
jgi:uncharacterized protein